MRDEQPAGERRAGRRGGGSRIPGWALAVGGVLIGVGFLAALTAAVVAAISAARPVPVQPPENPWFAPPRSPTVFESDPRADPFGAAGELPAFLRDRQPVDDEYPLPQNPDRMTAVRRRRVADARAAVVEPFDQHGRADAPWAAEARAALEEYAVRFARPEGGPPGSAEVRFLAAVAAAAAAGCDDPMVVYLKVQFLDPHAAGLAWGKVDPAERAAGYRAVLAALPAMRTGPAVRVHIAWNTFAGLEGLAQARAGGVSPAEAKAAYEQFWEAFRAAAREPGRTCRESVLEISGYVTQDARNRGLDRRKGWAEVAAALAAADAPAWTRAAAEGEFLVRYAWDARGNGLAGTVTDDGWQRLHERLAKARVKLQLAWDIDPDAAPPATRMLTVALGEGDDRAVMEMWFRRAMTADPDSQAACRAKLEWLQAKWYGSREEAVAFADQCFRTGNWHAGLPVLLERPLTNTDLGLQLGAVMHAGEPDLWGRLRAVQRTYLGIDPGDRATASRHARICSLALRAQDAAGHFRALGDGPPWPGIFTNQAEFEQFRDRALAMPPR